jgi:hypothetical protein
MEVIVLRRRRASPAATLWALAAQTRAALGAAIAKVPASAGSCILSIGQAVPDRGHAVAKRHARGDRHDMSAGLLSESLRPSFAEATRAVREGQSIANSMEQQGLTTPVAARMLRVGERSGNMGEMTERIAAFYDDELGRWVAIVTRLIEPLFMTVIGLLIGVIVVLMYFPIFQLAGACNERGAAASVHDDAPAAAPVAALPGARLDESAAGGAMAEAAAIRAHNAGGAEETGLGLRPSLPGRSQPPSIIDSSARPSLPARARFRHLPPSEATRRCACWCAQPGGLLAQSSRIPFDTDLRNWLETRGPRIRSNGPSLPGTTRRLHCRAARRRCAPSMPCGRKPSAQRERRRAPTICHYVSISDGCESDRAAGAFDGLRRAARRRQRHPPGIDGIGLVVRYRIDGVLVNIASVNGMPGCRAGDLALKVMSELDIAERRVPQDGRFKIALDRRPIDFRVSIIPSIFGEDAVCARSTSRR